MKKLIAKLLAFTLTTSMLFAGSVGTSSFYFLDINMGSVTGSMARAHVANRGTLEGLYHNPASLASMDGDLNVVTEVNPYMSAPEFTMMLFGVGGSYKLLDKFTVGGAFHGLSYGDMMIGVEDAESLGSTINPKNFAIVGAFAMNLNEVVGMENPALSIDVGASVRYALEDFGVEELEALHALSLDLGGIFTFNELIPNSALSAGIHVKNLGVPFGVEVDGEMVSLPVSMLVGAGYTIKLPTSFSLNMKLLTDLDLKLAHLGGEGTEDVSAQVAKVNIGYQAEIIDIFYVRAGYVIGEQTGGAAGLSFGAGVAYSFTPMIEAKVDYSFLSHGDLGAQQNIQVGATFYLKEPKTEDTASEEDTEEATEEEGEEEA